MKKLLLVLFLLPGVLQAQMAKPDAPRAKAYKAEFDGLQAYLGATFCDDKDVYAFVRVNVDPVVHSATIAHEMKHVEQRSRFPNCRAFQEEYLKPRGILQFEAEAYVAGLCVVKEAGGYDIEGIRGTFVQLLDTQLGGEVNRLVVLQTIQKYEKEQCP